MKCLRTLGSICIFLAIGYFMYNLQDLELYLPLIFILLFLGTIFCGLSYSSSTIDQEETEYTDTDVLTSDAEVYDQAFLKNYGDFSKIEIYNKEDHHYNIAINRSFAKVDNYLKNNPKAPIRKQLKIAELRSMTAKCPNCKKFLFLYKKFLVYCPNCELFIAEITRSDKAKSLISNIKKS